jgi:hypothetical protein
LRNRAARLTPRRWRHFSGQRSRHHALDLSAQGDAGPFAPGDDAGGLFPDIHPSGMDLLAAGFRGGRIFFLDDGAALRALGGRVI